jgi:hypothetical protein
MAEETARFSARRNATRILDLQRNVFGNELSVKLRLADFLDINLHLLAGLLCDFVLEFLDLSALLADNDARAGSMNDNLDLLPGTLDFNLCNAGMVQLLLDQLADMRSSRS